MESQDHEKTNENSNGKEIYQDKSDHEVILILEQQTLDQEKAILELKNSLNRTERENANLLKLQGQVSVVRLVFIGVLSLIGCMIIMSVISWWSPKGTVGLEKELAFFDF